jgi:signal transduction histidine kinase/ligand-binding sensor domain-containing protein
MIALSSCLMMAWLFLFLPGMARSTSPTETKIEQFHHSTWSAAAGAPHDIWSMAQGADGFLWLGTGEGLYQFDGVKFRQLNQFGQTFGSSNITALNIFPNGIALAGFYLGGATLIEQGKAQSFGKADGFPSGWVLDFAQTPDGAIWAAAKNGLARYQNGRWVTIGSDWGLPPNSAGWVLADKEGTLWVTGPSSLYFLPKSSHRFQDTQIALGVGAVLAIDPDGVLWVSDKVRGTRSLPGVTARHPNLTESTSSTPPGFITSNRMLFDHEGHMWGTDSQSGGIYVVLNPKAVEDGRSLHASDISFTVKSKDGLTSDLTDPLLCDREGNVWVGTNFGLDSFRLSNVSSIQGLDVIPGVDFNVAVDSKGGVWVLNGKTIYKVENGALHVAIKMPQVIHDLAGASDGALWFESDTDMFRMKDGVAKSVGLPTGVTEATIASFASDDAGGISVAFRNDGLYQWSAGHWNNADISPISDTPTTLSQDGGRVWMGYTNNRIAIRDAYGTRLFSAKDGLSIGAVSSFNVATSFKLVAGEQGLAHFKDGRFQSLSSFGAIRLGGISGIAYSNGDFWLNTNQGVIRVSALELQKAFDSDAYVPVYKLFQFRDGLPGFALQSKALPTALVDGRGQIWVDTDLGVAWIDPSRIRTNSTPPHVKILDVSSNGKHYTLKDPADVANQTGLPTVDLPKRTTNLDIEYTATSLSVPEGTNFRYKLDGVDDTWQEVGTRREAFYANLSPGIYAFHVMARNEDGIWSASPASISLYIPPMFYQTKLFLLACALVLAIVVALLFKMRLHQVAESVRNRMNERYAERERIARELHDTLLQSVQGLILSFQAIVQNVPSGKSSRIKIENILERADGVLIEIRDRVLDLRRADEKSHDLPRAFALIGEEFGKFGKDSPVSFHVVEKGGGRTLDPAAAEEIYRIGREAIINSYRHADADSIVVEISHGSDQFSVRFRDNGCGITDDIANCGKVGHWGLAGMRERAQRISGTLVMHGKEGVGTEVELKIPASAAYIGSEDPLKKVLRVIATSSVWLFDKIRRR